MNEDHSNRKIKTLGKTILFTNISNMEAQEIIDLYKKRNRVEHCFRAINTLDLASPIYH
ncbi:MAG: transposase [Thermoplasmata archaeon]